MLTRQKKMRLEKSRSKENRSKKLKLKSNLYHSLKKKN